MFFTFFFLHPSFGPIRIIKLTLWLLQFHHQQHPLLSQAHLLPQPKPVVKAPDFHTEVRAVLESTCISCHGANDQKGGLRLDTLAFAKEGGDSGPAIVPGNKIESTLLERIHLPADDDEIMPPKNGPLSAQQKDILDRWIETGANWPKGIQLKEITERELVLRTKARNKQFVSLTAYPSGHNSYDQGRFQLHRFDRHLFG